MDISNNIIISKNDSKRCRKTTAVKLPKELTESMIPKYVVYYRECYNKERMCFREYFKIEKHPKTLNNNKLYISSKSNKINILEKLEQIKSILERIELENESEGEENSEEDEEDVESENNVEKIVLPKYISVKKHEKDENKYYLIYDKKNLAEEKRETHKLLFYNKYTFSQNLAPFMEKVKEKYSADC